MDFTEETVRRIVKDAINSFKGTGWDYLAKQFPVLLDDELSTVDKANLDTHDTFSFANPYYVGFSESRALKQITDYYSSKKLALGYLELERNIKNVLIHEYGHILLEHVFEKPKTNELDIKSQVITAEIETNRGVSKNTRGLYFDDIIISDEKPMFETVQPFITHQAVFNAVKRVLEKEQKQQKPQDDQCNDRGGGGDEENSEQKQQQGQDKNGSLSPPSPDGNNSQQQDGGDDGKDVKKPDQVGTMVQAMKDAGYDDKSPRRDILTELGLQPSKDFNDSRDVKARLKSLQKLVQNNNIKKALYKIKGALAGELSRDKVGTYSRPSRKVGEDGLMRRGTKRAPNKRPKILIALDESGSMNTTAVQTAATAVKMIARTIGRNRTDVTICSFCHYIDKVEKLSNYERVVNSYNPHGGTSFDLVVELAEKQGCDVVICIGDGQDYLPNRPFNGKLKKWIDVLITQTDCSDDIRHYEYNSELDDERRETYWLGDNKDKVAQYASEM